MVTVQTVPMVLHRLEACGAVVVATCWHTAGAVEQQGVVEMQVARVVRAVGAGVLAAGVLTGCAGLRQGGAGPLLEPGSLVLGPKARVWRCDAHQVTDPQTGQKVCEVPVRVKPGAQGQTCDIDVPDVVFGAPGVAALRWTIATPGYVFDDDPTGLRGIHLPRNRLGDPDETGEAADRPAIDYVPGRVANQFLLRLRPAPRLMLHKYEVRVRSADAPAIRCALDPAFVPMPETAAPMPNSGNGLFQVPLARSPWPMTPAAHAADESRQASHRAAIGQ